MDTYYQYVCLDCGWIYDETLGYPEAGIPARTRWEDVSDDFKCPECDTRKRDAHMWQKIAI